jgi:ankyrin repeat protein
VTPAHTIVAKACLGILLHLDRDVAKDALQPFPLAPYAALHWADHARIEGVSQNVEDGMNVLLDSSKPHLAAWVSLHNTELPSWKLFKRGERPLPPSGTPLHYATICGLHAFVKVLVVERPHDVDTRGSYNLTPLHMASLWGCEEVARVLLQSDADVTAQGDRGETPLHMASSEGHLQLVHALLEHGGSTTARDKFGLTPLHLALIPRDLGDPYVHGSGAVVRTSDEGENRLAQLDGASQIDLLSYLFSQEASVQVTRDPLKRGVHTAAQGGILFHATLRHRYTGPLRFHLKPEADAMVGDKSTLSHLASRRGHLEVAQLLVKHGADPTAGSKLGICPLHLASFSGNMEVLQFLVKHRADSTVQDSEGWTPLHMASRYGHVEIVQFFVEHGTDLTALSNNGWTSLHFASGNGPIEAVQLLVEHGADPRVQNKDAITPLHLSSQNGHIEIVQFLVAHGADPTAQDNKGLTPLYYALGNRHVELLPFLVKHGADPPAHDKLGLTLLNVAAPGGHMKAVQLLVEHGADPTAPDEDGWTPLHSASDNGHVEIMQFLVGHGADPTAQDINTSGPLCIRRQKMEMSKLCSFLLGMVQIRQPKTSMG